jgi:hypothetical protein
MRLSLLFFVSVFFVQKASSVCVDTFNSISSIALPGDSVDTLADPSGAAIYVPDAYTYTSTYIAVTLNGFTAMNPHSLTIWIESPNGENVLLMRSDSNTQFVSGLSLKFASNSTNAIPSSTLQSGTYTNHKVMSDSPYFYVNMTDLEGVPSTGIWKLYVQGDESSTIVVISSWSITLHTSCLYPHLSPPKIVICNEYIELVAGPNTVSDTTDETTLAVDMTENGTIYDISVHITDFYATEGSKIIIQLEHDGTIVTLMHNVSTTFGDTDGISLSFQDGASTFPVSNTPSGTYRPTSIVHADETELSLFKGMDPDGDWIIRFTDLPLLGDGAGIEFGSVSLNITTDCGTHTAPTIDCEEGVNYEIMYCGVEIEEYEGYFTDVYDPGVVLVTYDPEVPSEFLLGTTEVTVTATSYYGQVDCEVAAIVFTPDDIEPCGTNGTCDGLECDCVTGYAGSWCCPITSGSDTVCGGEDNGACIIGGTCGCETGFGGDYCCPESSGQVSACGEFGTCLRNATCVCEEGYIGDSCAVNSRCPSDDVETECSAQGTCTEIAVTECLESGERFINNASVVFSIGGVEFMDEGRVSLINRTITFFGLGDPTDPTIYEQFYDCLDEDGDDLSSDRSTCILTVMQSLATSDIINETLTLENYPTAAIGPHADGGVYLAVKRAVYSFLKLETELLITNIAALGGGDCVDYLDSNPTHTRSDCLGYYILLVTAQPQAHSAYTRYGDSHSVNVTVGATTHADEGLARLIQYVAYAFLQVEPDNRTLVNHYMATDCDELTRYECMVAILTAIIEGPEWSAVIAPYGLDLNLYANDTFRLLRADDTIDITEEDAMSFALALLANEPEDVIEAIVALSCYPWVSASSALPLDVMTWPKHLCVCGTTVSGTTSDGYALIPGGPTCELACPRGLEGIPCSGFSQGVLRGTCQFDVEDAGHCVCEDGWGGTACNFPTIDYCYAFNQTIECGGVRYGSCIQTEVGEPEFHCSCVLGWSASHCEHAFCPTDEDGVCHDEGVCEEHATDPAPRCHCFVTANLAESDDPDDPPLLPTGAGCDVDGIEECGIFWPNGLDPSVGTWVECSLNGHCTSNGTTQCECTAGYYGEKCQFTDCPDTVCPGNGRSFCNSTTSDCQCNPMWSTADDCVEDSCVCGTSLCGHGTPDVETGTACECDESWEKLNGTCTIPVCPMIVRITGGERLCTSNDPLCEDDEDSLENQCCYQACPDSCSFNETTAEFVCDCGEPALAYVQSDGVCFTYCHGQPYTISEDELEIICNCTALSGESNVWDETCLVRACLNGGTANEDHTECVCPDPFTGDYCEVAACGSRGEPDTLLGVCECYPPFFRPYAPSRLSCLIDVVHAFVNSDAFVAGLDNFINDPEDSTTIDGVVYGDEDYVAIARDLVESLAAGDEGRDNTVVDLETVILTPSVDTFNQDSAVSTFCSDTTRDLSGTCPARMAMSIAISVIAGLCPSARCRQAISALGSHTSHSPAVTLSQFLLDGETNYLCTILSPASPWTDDSEIAIDVQDHTFEDEGQVVLISNIQTVFTENEEADPVWIQQFYNEDCQDEDGVARTACLQEVILQIVEQTEFSSEIQAAFPDDPGQSVTVGSTHYTDEGLVGFIQAAATLYPLGISADAAVGAFIDLCEAATSVGCKKKALLSMATCTNAGRCQDGPCMTNCVEPIFSQTVCESNNTALLARCLLSDMVLEPLTPTGCPFFSSALLDSPSTSLNISGHMFTDESQAGLIRNLMRIFKVGNYTNATQILSFMDTCPEQATEIERVALCEGSNANGGVVALSSRQGVVYDVICPSNQIIGPNMHSCSLLDCNTYDGAVLCAQCVHGVAWVFNNTVQCDCSGTGYTGTKCETFQCHNGGHVMQGDGMWICMCPFPFTGLTCAETECENDQPANEAKTACACNFPYTGDTCGEHVCANGGTPNPTQNKCNCLTQWTGAICTVPVVSASTGIPSISSSSSTADESLSSTADEDVTNSSTATEESSTGVIVAPTTDLKSTSNTILKVLVPTAVGVTIVTLGGIVFARMR